MKHPTNSDQLHGTLDMLVLKVLDGGTLHGYAIAVRLERMSRDVLSVEEGSLYPALYRMARKGWIKAQWRVTENNRRAKYYNLTAEGRRQFREQTSGWQRFASAVSAAVTTKTAPSWAK